MSKYAHLIGTFRRIVTLHGRRVWPGGDTTMPYFASGGDSRTLTDEELEAAYPEIKP